MTQKPYRIKKRPGSSQAYIVRTATGEHVDSFNVSSTRGWESADKKLARLNAEARDGVKR